MSTTSDFSKGVDNASDMVLFQNSNRVTLYCSSKIRGTVAVALKINHPLLIERPR